MHRKEPALTEGSYRSFTANNGTVLGVIRNSGSRTVLLLINFKDDIPQQVDLSAEGLPPKMRVKVANLDSRLKRGYDFFEYFLKIVYVNTYNSVITINIIK